MRNLHLPLFALLVCGFVLSGHTPVETETHLAARFKTKKEQPRDVIVDVSGSTGIGVFQDIQVPVNEDFGLRADGKRTESEYQDHQGIPLIGSIGLMLPFGPWGFATGMEFIQLSSTAGPADTQSSSYSRADLHMDWMYRFGREAGSESGGHVSIRAAGRRSAFMNVSNGHHIDALLLGLRGGYTSYRSYELLAYASMAPTAYFAYDTGSGLSGERFQGSRTSLSEAGILTSFYLRNDAWFDLGLERETAQVVIEDISEYASFGLGMSPDAKGSRQYELATTILRVGFHKDF